MKIRVKLKKLEYSLGFILPREFIDKKNLSENDIILIEVVKKADLSEVFGVIKKRKLSGQKFKELVRKGWNK